MGLPPKRAGLGGLRVRHEMMNTVITQLYFL